jgi:hypothetical protein
MQDSTVTDYITLGEAKGIIQFTADRVQNFVAVTMGSEKKEADIVVYNDDAKPNKWYS